MTWVTFGTFTASGNGGGAFIADAFVLKYEIGIDSINLWKYIYTYTYFV